MSPPTRLCCIMVKQRLRLNCSDFCNQDGKVSQLEHVFIRGSKVRYVRAGAALFISISKDYCHGLIFCFDQVGKHDFCVVLIDKSRESEVRINVKM